MITPSLRDGLLFLTYPRHFVPGYYRAIPPGRGRQTAIKLALMGFNPGYPVTKNAPLAPLGRLERGVLKFLDSVLKFLILA